MKTLPDSIKRLYPFNCEQLNINGLAMNYVDEGPENAPAVIMLHGNPSWSFYYRNVIQALKTDHRVIVPDHIGCGLSDKPQDYHYCLRTNINNVRRLLQHLCIDKASLIVHDWGGAIGMGLLAEDAFQLDRLVILNTAAFIMPRVPMRIRMCRVPGLGPLAVRGANAFAGGAAMMATETPLASDVKAGLLYPYDNWQNRVAVLRFVQDIPMKPSHVTWDLANRIHESLPRFKEHPIQIHWGVKDFCFNMEVLAMWKQIYPNATVFEYPDAGHYVLEDAHASIVPEVRNFLCPEIS